MIRKGEREISEAAERLCSISHQHLESDTTIRPCEQRAAEMHRNYLHETTMAEDIGREHVREEDTASLSASKQSNGTGNGNKSRVRCTYDAQR